MEVLLAVAFISGLLSIFSPCIWSILPVVLSSSFVSGKTKPLGITLGVVTTFILATLFLSTVLNYIPIEQNDLRIVSIVILVAAGLTMIIPQLNALVEGLISSVTHVHMQRSNEDFLSGVFTGVSLGLLWTPCTGPIMTMIATLAAVESVDFPIVLIALAYGAGVSIPLFTLTFSEQWLYSHHPFLKKFTRPVQVFFGIIMIATSILIFTGYDRILITKFINVLPYDQTYYSPAETLPSVRTQLEELRRKRLIPTQFILRPTQPPAPNNPTPTQYIPSPIPSRYRSSAPVLGQAQEISGITRWFNTPNNQPLSLQQLRGRVVLLDFWAYTCEACLTTISLKNTWKQQYPNVTILAVHVPGSNEARSEENIANAIKQYGVTYPVAVDANFSTFDSYHASVLPTEYLIDKNGFIRFTTIHTSDSGKMDQLIQELLQE